MQKHISVIIPVLNEEKYIGQMLNSLIERSHYLEIIVVDGGSTDRSIEIVNEYSEVKLISTKAGRAMQMNSGAKQAIGEYLLFLHADSVLQNGFFGELKSLLPTIQAGCFKMNFDVSNFWLDLYSRFTHLNWSIFTYGDQGLLIKSEIFNKIGGFKEMPILEDLEIVRRIKKQYRFSKIDLTITTSSRKFKKYGFIFQQLKNTFIVAAYYLGASPFFLKRFYRYS